MILLLVLNGTTHGQVPDVITFVDEGAVYLRWKSNLKADGYNIYRKSNADWQLLNTNPITFIKDNAKLREILGSQVNMYLGLFNVPTITSDISEDNIKAVQSDEEAFKWIEVLSVINPTMAKALGLIYVDSTINKGELYQYQIKPIVYQQEQIGWTSDVIVSHTQTVPEANDFGGHAINSAAILSWQKDQTLLDNGDVVTYHLYRSEDILGPFTRVNQFGMLPANITTNGYKSDPTIQEYVDKYLTNGKPYFYFVKTANSFGIESKASPVVEIIPGDNKQPLPPINLTISPLGNAAHLKWEYLNDDLKGVYIYRSEDGDSFDMIYPLSDLLLSKETAYVDMNIIIGQRYFYQLRSVSQNNIVGEASVTVSFGIDDIIPPAPPQNVTARSEQQKIIISWSKSLEKDIVGFQIARGNQTDYDIENVIQYEYIPDTFYIDEFNEKYQGTYGYSVMAIDQSGNKSKWSERAEVRLKDKIPPAKPIITSTHIDQGGLHWEWSKNSETDWKGYNIYQSTDDVNYKKISSIQNNKYAVQQTTNELNYYKVSAFDMDNNESELSQKVVYNTVSKYPDAPPSGKIEQRDNHIVLSWKPVTNDQIMGYLITKYVNGQNGTDIKQVKANDKLEYKDTFFQQNTLYKYEIRAYTAEWIMSKPLSLSLKIK